MATLIRKGGIYLAVFIVCIAFTVISPFFSKVAIDQGVSESLIGFIFSATPVSSLFLSLFLSKFMQNIGRTVILISGLFLIGISNIILAFITFCSSGTTAFLISIFSRGIAGLGSSMGMIDSYSILTSDYPEHITQTIASVEIASGVGLVIGPTIGSIIFSIGGFFYSCIIIGLLVIGYLPILFCLVGKSKPYLASEELINLKDIAFKPVRIK